MDTTKLPKFGKQHLNALPTLKKIDPNKPKKKTHSRPVKGFGS